MLITLKKDKISLTHYHNPQFLTPYFSKYFQNTKIIFLMYLHHFYRCFKFFSTRLAFNVSFSKSLIFLIDSTLLFFKNKKNKKNKKYLDTGTKMKRKKMRDQRVFGTKQWGGKRQIILPINR